MQWYVLGFAFDERRKRVVLIEKNKPDWQKGLLNGVGGKIEENELCDEAMSREFEEETGVKTESDQWRHFANMQGKDWKVVCYSIKLTNILDCGTTTDEKVSVHDLDWLPANIISNIPWLLAIEADKDLLERVLEICYP